MKTNMEVRKRRDTVISKIKTVTVIIVTLLTVLSCRSTDVEGNLNPGGQVAVNVNIEDDIFEGISNIGSKASAKKTESTELPVIQKSTVAFSEDFYMVAELTEEVPIIAQMGVKASLQKGNKGAQTSALKPNIKYKTVVYKSTGEYVTEKDYARGQETSSGPLLLYSGSYTFVVYSINSTSVLPAVVFADPANKTLSNSSVAVTGSQDLMYFRKDMTISASKTNYLGVVLKHKFSQITTTVDATATGYNITAITSAINPQHRPNASMALSDGTLTRSGTATSVEVSFPTLGAQTITATPTLINAATITTGSYTISSITIGTLTQENITPFSDLVITPGVKYNMKVKIVPSDDAYIIHEGIPAVRINGQIWMRHNVGVNTAVDPDVANSLIHGNYYQWGRRNSIGSGTSTTVSGWNGNNNPSATAWNSKGDETFSADGPPPVKTANDPCPAGFRVPSYFEFSELRNNVTFSDVGSSFSSPANYSYAKVLTSKRNSNVKMTLPGQGWYNTNSTGYPYTANSIQVRGQFGYYWTSSRLNGGVWHYFFSKDNGPSLNIRMGTGSEVDVVVGRVIRCIAQ